MTTNPQIRIPGYGVLPLDHIKSEIVHRVNDLAERAKSGQWKQVEHLTKDGGIIALFAKTVVQVEERLANEKDKIAKAPRNESPMQTGNSFNGADVGDGKKCPAPTQWEDFRKQLVIALSKTKTGIDPVWLKHLTVPHLDDQVSYPLVKVFEYSQDSVNRHVASDDLHNASWTDFDEGLLIAGLVESYKKWVSNFKYTTATDEENKKVALAGQRAFQILTKR